MEAEHLAQLEEEAAHGLAAVVADLGQAEVVEDLDLREEAADLDLLVVVELQHVQEEAGSHVQVAEAAVPSKLAEQVDLLEEVEAVHLWQAEEAVLWPEAGVSAFAMQFPVCSILLPNSNLSS